MSTDLKPIEQVVLIHGWISHPLLMKPLEWRLQRAGFATCNWGYRSLTRSIQEHAQDFATYLHQLDQAPGGGTFHIVGHSLGSIITRCVLQHYRLEHLGRVVMLCPPNRGSHMARRATTLLTSRFGNRFENRLRTLTELSDANDSFVNQLPLATRAQIGIIIATGDRVVYENATRLEDAADYATVPGMHNAVLFKRTVVDLCVRFLKSGKFKEDSHVP